MNFFGGSIEGNGAAGVGTDRGGVFVYETGLEGGVAATFDGVYFELNQGAADIMLAVGSAPAVLAVNNCNFNRVGSAELYASYNIAVGQANTDGNMTVSCRGNSHRGFGGYVPSINLPVIRMDCSGTWSLDAPFLETITRTRPSARRTGRTTLSRGRRARPHASTSSTSASPALVLAMNVVSITKHGTGDYTITPARGTGVAQKNVTVTTNDSPRSSRSRAKLQTPFDSLYSTARMQHSTPATSSSRSLTAELAAATSVALSWGHGMSSTSIEILQMASLLAKQGGEIPADVFGGEWQAGSLAHSLRRHLEIRDIPTPPPEKLQRRVIGVHVPEFVDIGFRVINDFNAVLARNVGRTIGDFQHVLDFGVGCGRVIRRMAEAYPKMARTGADIDGEAVAWLNGNYSKFGNFVTLPHRPQSSIPAGSFDLVYSISVFTHLPEDMQFEWLAELRRVTAPGAILLLTIHGEKYLKLFPEAAQQKAAAAGGFFYNDDAGLTEGLPEFYKNTYHTPGYIKQKWSKYFDILEHSVLGLEEYQDIVVCRRPNR